MYTAPFLDVKNTSSAETVSWIELTDAFESNEISATERFVDKVVEVKGDIIDITQSNDHRIIVIGQADSETSVICQIQEDESKGKTQVNIGDTVIIKGICTGYLMDVMLIRCKIINPAS
jgi:hypothetical protein